MTDSNAPGILSGIRVVSFTHFYVGAGAAQYLGDLGAEVIKVEPKGTGAWERSWSPGGTMIGDTSLLFMMGSRNTKSVAVDLKSEAGLQVARELVASADVLIQNYRPGVLRRFGLDYESVRELNPKIVYGSVSGYGLDGPFSDLPGQDYLLQAESGLLWMAQRPDGIAHYGAPIVDMHSATLLAFGVAAALVRAQRTGVGEHVEVEMLRAAIELEAEPLLVYLNHGRYAHRTAPLTASYTLAPGGVYETADGHLALSQSPLTDVVRAMGIDVDFSDLGNLADEFGAGFDARETIHARIAPFFREKTTTQWLDTLRAEGVWCAPVVSYEDIEHHPPVEASQPFVSVETPEGGAATLVTHPVKYGGKSPEISSVAPPLGSHTRQVLSDLGYTDDSIDELIRAGNVE